jgi:serine phosphatase RsbU (regulator of sigma subunit)
MQRGAGGWARAAIDTADRLLERREPDVARRLDAREWRVELVAALAFVVIALLGAVAADEPWPGAWTVAGLVLTYAVLAEIRLQLGPGLVGPTQLVFVPMLFLVPPLAVPLLVVAGELLGELSAIARRRAHPERAFVAMADSWYSLGPAAVVAAYAPSEAWYVFVLALVAQFATDFLATSAREGLGAGIPAARLAPVMGLIYTVDALLTPVGVLVVLASKGHPAAFLLVLGPAALLAALGHERRTRIERELELGRAYRRSYASIGEAVASRLERGELERVLLSAATGALQADRARLLERGEPMEPGEYAVALPGAHNRRLAVMREGRRFDADERELVDQLAKQAAASLENLELHEITRDIAQTLQASLLPPVLPEIERLETAALYRAAGEGHEVGGDFYDVFSTGGDQWFAVIGDVCGKGAEAAAVTALARYTLRAAVVQHRSPARMLRWLNDAMLRQKTGPTRFATIACVRFDIDKDGTTATVACGGHPSPRVLRTTGLVESIGEPGTLLGVLGKVRLEDRSTRLGHGDALVLYTDGLTEAGAPRRVWTPEQLDAAVASARRASAQEIVERLAQEALGDEPPRDDLALLAVKVRT